MKFKKTVMGLAALLILIFHFYIPFSKSTFEMCFQRAAYVGVDLFFFLTAISLGTKEKIDFVPFILNRLKTIYLPFALFSVLAAVYKGWKISRFFKVIFGVELFEKGGGAFVWFAPAIMLVYILIPVLLRLKSRFGIFALGIMSGAWLVSVIVLQYAFDYTQLFILLNRLPLIFIGLYYKELFGQVSRNKYVWAWTTGLLVVSIALLFKFGAVYRISEPLKDIYYLLAIPFSVALILLADYICSHRASGFKVLEFVGGMTFDIYCLQMIFGYDIELFLAKYVGNNILAFVFTSLLLIGAAFLLKQVRRFL